MNISNREIGENKRPYIIAELSGNHNGSYINAKKIIDAPKWAGVDAIKLQTFKPELMTIDSSKKILLLIMKTLSGQIKHYLVYFQKRILHGNGIQI